MIPSLKEKTPTLDSLLPILSECVSQNAKNALTTVAVPQQLQPSSDETIPLPIMVPKLQIPKSPPAIPYRAPPMEPLPSTSAATDYHSKPISLEMFNCAAADLNDKGVINLKKYKKYLYKPC